MISHILKKIERFYSLFCAAILLVFAVFPLSVHASYSTLRPTVHLLDAKVHSLHFSIKEFGGAAEYGGTSYYEVRSSPYRESSYSTELIRPKIFIVQPKATEFFVNNLRSGRYYHVQVYAHYNDGNKSFVVWEAVYTKPHRPRFMHAESVTDTSAVIKWKKLFWSQSFSRTTVEVYEVDEKYHRNIRIMTINDRQHRKMEFENLKSNTTYEVRAYAHILGIPTTITNWSDPIQFHTKYSFL